MTFKKISVKVKRLFVVFCNWVQRNFFSPPSLDVLIDDHLEFVKNGNPKCKILYIATKYDYGDKTKGLSYEEHNFYHAIKKMQDVEVVRFDFYSICSKYGKKYANEMIKEVALLEDVNKVLILLYLDQFDYGVLRELSSNYSIEVILWLFDDDKRYLETAELVKNCAVIVTTIKERHYSRLASGINSRLAQFAANHNLYKNFRQEKIYDVVFVGQNFGNRQMYVDYLKSNDINILTYGRGWINGKLSQARMIDLFNKSKIVLNFSSSFNNPTLKNIKGRVFEIPATGAFLLTEDCNDLSDYFSIGAEIEAFGCKEELLRKVKFYLENDDLREMIAKKGREVVVEKYTYERYLSELFFEKTI